MHLTDLKRPGTRLSEVEPLFTGMPLKQWLAEIERSRVQAFCAGAEWRKARESQRWDKKACATKRDDYGK